MTQQLGKTTDSTKDAQDRIAQMAALFVEIADLIQFWRDQEEPITLAATKQMMGKMSELQTAHLMVLRAQEAFYDKFKPDDIGRDTTDYDAIRRDIGRKLDRIRAVLDAK